jgi:hypothetical protein
MRIAGNRVMGWGNTQSHRSFSISSAVQGFKNGTNGTPGPWTIPPAIEHAGSLALQFPQPPSRLDALKFIETPLQWIIHPGQFQQI